MSENEPQKLEALVPEESGFARLGRGNLLAGIVAVTPIAVTAAVIYFLFSYLSQLGRVPAKWISSQIENGSKLGEVSRLNFLKPVVEFIGHEWFVNTMSVAFVIAILYIIGWLTRNVLGRQLIALLEWMLHRIPFVKTVYGAVKKFVLVLQQRPGGDIKRVVLIEFPTPEMKTVGLVTRLFTEQSTGRKLAAVYVPTTPNPTSGYLEIVPVERIVSTNWSLDEAMTFIISGGAIAPEEIVYTHPRDAGQFPSAEPKAEEKLIHPEPGA